MYNTKIRNKQRIFKRHTFSHELTLIHFVSTLDTFKNPIKTEIRSVVLCDVLSVGSREFYEANVQALKPERTFVVHSFEYSGQDLVEYEGQKFQVIRVYDNEHEETELTCVKVVANG